MEKHFYTQKIRAQNSNLSNKLIQKLTMSCWSRHKRLHHSTKKERRRNSRRSISNVNIYLINIILSNSSYGSKGISSASISPTVDSTCDLFDEPTLGSIVFFCALRCLRKVAIIGVVIWINSREGKFCKSEKFRILRIKTRKYRLCFLDLLLCTSIMI